MIKDPTNIRFGKNLAVLRRAKGWTQGVLAKKAGLSKVYVGKLERGERGVSIITGKQLGKALGCKRDVLLRGAWE